MNKKAQVSVFTIVFWIIIFILIMAAGLGGMVTTMSGVAINSGSLSGIEAFFVANLILWFFLAFIIAAMWWSSR